jgi:hypothetical protein
MSIHENPIYYVIKQFCRMPRSATLDVCGRPRLREFESQPAVAHRAPAVTPESLALG